MAFYRAPPVKITIEMLNKQVVFYVHEDLSTKRSGYFKTLQTLYGARAGHMRCKRFLRVTDILGAVSASVRASDVDSLGLYPVVCAPL
jgi:hypothetical protein